MIASGIQYDCHTYLSSLPKYTLPVHPIFQLIICPHYSSECLLYLAMTFLAAPRGKIVNQTVLNVLLFVLVNLGVSAGMTKEWYVQKFGADKVAERWKMIPFVY